MCARIIACVSMLIEKSSINCNVRVRSMFDKFCTLAGMSSRAVSKKRQECLDVYQRHHQDLLKCNYSLNQI